MGFFLLLPGPAPARLSKRVIARRIHPRMRQKLANCHYLILGKAVLGIVEGMRLAIQLHRQAARAIMGYLAPQLPKHGLNRLGVNIGADGMGEDGVQYLAMTMIHDGVPPLRV
ncbi:MAG: hypothetical protein ACKO54_15710 [Alphaproteobacteria bacterium]